MSQRDIFAFLNQPRTDPLVIPLQLRKTEFREIYQPFEADLAANQSDRCLDCGNPYCQWKCPVHNYIPDWLDLAAQGRIKEAADLCHATNSLPEVCGRICPQDRLCEGACTLATGFGAVTIGAVEKYIVDQALEQGWKPDLSQVRPLPFKVGIIGAGPAGLACADVLARNGIQTEVYDRYPEIGGLLSFGIPEFKLELGVMQRRRRLFEQMGIRFHLNCEIGKHIQADQLLQDFDALLIATGTYNEVTGKLPGQDHQQIVPALPYLIGETDRLYDLQIADARHIDLKGQTVLVLGGGDTAMDCVRTAIRQQAAKVTCVYRRDRDNMPGSQREVSHAEKEGVEFLFNAQPLEIVSSNDRLQGVRIVKTRMQQEPGSDRQVPEIVAGSEQLIPATAVIFAFGYRPSPPQWLQALAVETEADGRIKTSSGDFSGQTSNPKVFAAGDMVSGSDLVVTAIDAGRKAANAIVGSLKADR